MNMAMSDTVTKLAPALLAAQQSMGAAKKGAENPFYKSSYADLNAIREVVLPAANAQGITVLQPTVVVDGKNYVNTMLLHVSGEYLCSLTEIKNTKGDAQSEGSGISYARRYGLQSLFNVGAVDDDAETTMKRDTKATKLEAAVKAVAESTAVVKTTLKDVTPEAASKAVAAIPAPNKTSFNKNVTPAATVDDEW